MKTLNHVTKLLAVAVAGFACTANAATVNASTSTTVVNSFGLVNTTALNFGDLRASRGNTALAANAAALKISADPGQLPAATVPGAGGAILSSLGGVQRGVFDITGAAPFAELTINFPTTDTTLSADPAVVGPGAPTLVVPAQATNEWTAWILTGPRAASLYDATTRKLQTTTGGAVSFQIGATLKTVETGTVLIYPDAPYTGNYNLEVVY